MPFDATPPEVKTRTVVSVLRRARQIIDENGWCQGRLQDDTGRVCASGAIIFAAGGHVDRGEILWGSATDDCKMSKTAHSSFQAAASLNVMIPVWNDAPETTAKQVLAAFDAAIVWLDAAG